MRASSGVRFYLGVLACALAVVALVASCKKKPKTPACDGNDDCKNGLVCVNKQCVQCAKNEDCDDGTTCVNGACVRPECTKDNDCPSGTACLDGKCKSCTSNDECGPGGQCEGGSCKRATACKTDAECADDEDCVNGFCQKPTTVTEGPCALATIYFGYDDSSIAASERDRLDANTACIEKNGSRSLLVVGHTDGTGTEEYNIALSERRAQSVADYLARLGIDPARLQVVPKGETELTGQGDEKDRRVEFSWR
jgi:hypothetical protein